MSHVGVGLIVTVLLHCTDDPFKVVFNVRLKLLPVPAVIEIDCALLGPTIVPLPLNI